MVALGLLTSVAGMPASAYGDSRLDDQQVKAYAERFSVSNAAARKDLRLQQRVGDLADTIADQLGPTYGGIWFNQDLHRVEIGVAGRMDSRVRTRVRRLELGPDVAFVGVEKTYAELGETAEAVRRTLSDDRGFDGTSVALDPRHNAVVAKTQSGDVTDARAQLASAQIDSTTVMPLTSQYGPAACTWASLASRCSPFRGAQAITSGSRVCSAGFYATRNPGEKFVLTAGHCFAGGFTGTWYAQANAGNVYAIGPAGGWINGSANPNGPYMGDVAAINISSTSNWYPGMSARVFADGFDQNYPITSRVRSQQGWFHCHLGTRTPNTGANCGTVTSLGGTYQYQSGVTYNNLTNMTGCVNGGDSGGPVVNNYRAIGIVSGGSIGACTSVLYSEVLDVEYWIGGVTVATL